MDRKEFLKTLGLIGVGSTFIGLDAKADNLMSAIDPALASAPEAAPVDAPEGEKIPYRARSLKAEVSKPITVCIIGAGNRGRTYASYAHRFPECMKIVGVSDIRESRKTAMAERHNIPAEHRFGDFHEVFEVPKFCDAVVVSTPDDTHYEPCMMALAKGYDVLLEKPVSPTEKECRNIVAQAHKYGRIVGVCHVLRYAPYFIALKEAIDSGEIGELVSIQHQEPIQYAHMSHSYVRGIWRNSDTSTPIILAKSCHDLDILRWMVGKPCKSIVADGSLTYFKKENAPAEATSHCTECPIEKNCPYSAVTIYARDKGFLGVFDLDRWDEDHILHVLKDTEIGRQYSRCVFKCDNNQPDHYVCNMVFEGGVTASFSMDAFTPVGGRRTRVMGTLGYIEGDGDRFTLTKFGSPMKKKVWYESVEDLEEYKGSGHGGGDLALARDFVEAVATHDAGKLSSDIDVSLESHIMGFRAEKSRRSGKKEKVD